MNRMIETVRRIPPLRAIPFLCLVVGMAFAPSAAMATPVSGSLQLGGTFTIGSTFLNFCETVGPCAAAPGNWNVPGNGTGDLSNPYANDPNGGLITNLNTGNAPVGVTLGGNGLLFLTFAPSAALPSPDIQFYLTRLDAGVGGTGSCAAPAAAGQTCTLTGSPVTFLNGGSNNSSATITMTGLARRISTNEFDPLTMVFTAQFNTPYQTVLAALAAQGTITQTYSASFTAIPIPEPATFGLIGAALVGLGLFQRRRSRI